MTSLYVTFYAIIYIVYMSILVKKNSVSVFYILIPILLRKDRGIYNYVVNL